MNEMKRRVAAILEFISRTQVELAGVAGSGEQTPSSAPDASNGNSGTGRGSTRANAVTASLLRNLADGLPMIMVNGDGKGKGRAGPSGEKSGATGGDSHTKASTPAPDVAGSAPKDFADLSSLEMMDVLTRKLVLWQKDFGKYGEKA